MKPIKHQVIKHPLATEKVIRLMESDNTLAFIVHQDAEKEQIKKTVEEMFKAKVQKVTTTIYGGQKRAYVKFAQETRAIDIATQLGLM